MRVRAEAAGERVDVFLTRSCPELTRSAVQRLLEQGSVTYDGRPVKKNAKTEVGATYDLTIPEVRPVEIVPQDIPLDVVYEDSDVLVINKPKGLVVHPAAGHEDGTLVNALLHHCGDSLSGINGEKRPGIVHRIDMDTSGLLIVAKNDFAHQALAAQLADHSLYRLYHGVATGNLPQEEGTVSAPIARSPKDRKKMAVVAGGKEAVTHYKVMERIGGCSYAQFRLETGRTHQIRVHMAHLGHPLLGDVVYGNPKGYSGLAGQCLHAKELSFLHPRSGERVTVSCDLPEYFQKVLTKLRNMG